MSTTYRIQQLRQFVIAAETGSLQTAAAETFRSAAAVSTAMSELEQQVGAPLFEKGHRARLTPLGRTLAPLFADLVRAHDRVARDVHQITLAERGLLTVAVIPFLAEEWFSSVLAQFMEKHRDVTVRVIDQRSRQARQLVSDGLADLAVVSNLGDDPKLEFQPVCIDTFGVICRNDDPLALRRGKTTWKALADRPLISNDAFATIIDHGLGQYVESNTVVTVSSRTSTMDLIRRGIGVTVLPRLTKPPSATDMAFVQLSEPLVSRSIGVVTRRGQTLLPAAAAMAHLIERELREYARRHGVALTDEKPPAKTKRKTR